jgi:biopolymer transport protein ExbB
MVWNISIAEYLAMGGWVMLPLVIFAFVLALLISERVLFYWELGKNDITPDTLVDLLEKDRVPDNGRSGICNQLLHLFLGAKERYGKLDMMIIEEITKGFIPELTKNLLIIAALTKAAPLLGLLGTVSGMITTFNVMNIFGTGNAKAMSGGISDALITTQFGLVVAIIGIYVSMFLTRRARHFETLVREIGVHIMRKFRL